MQKTKIQANHVTENSILRDVICLEIQNLFLCSSFKIMQPQNVFLKKIETLDSKP